MDGFTAKSSIATLNICQILMRLNGYFKINSMEIWNPEATTLIEEKIIKLDTVPKYKVTVGVGVPRAIHKIVIESPSLRPSLGWTEKL